MDFELLSFSLPNIPVPRGNEATEYSIDKRTSNVQISMLPWNLTGKTKRGREWDRVRSRKTMLRNNDCRKIVVAQIYNVAESLSQQSEQVAFIWSRRSWKSANQPGRGTLLAWLLFALPAGETLSFETQTLHVTVGWPWEDCWWPTKDTVNLVSLLRLWE